MGYIHRPATLCICLVLLHLCTTGSGQPLYMDSMSVCGTTKMVGLNPVSVQPRGPGGLANPPTPCVLQMESSFQESSYEFEIVVEAAVFVDCGLTLNIFNGLGVGGNHIRSLGCGSTKSTGQFYSNDRSITLELKRSRDQYIIGSHFSLSIKVYKNENAGTEFLGSSRLSAGAIIGIALGIVVLIAFAILIGWCYKTGRLGSGADEYPTERTKPEKRDDTYADGNENGTFVSWNMRRDADKLSTTTASRSNFDLDDSRMWDSLTATAESKPNKSENENRRNLNSGRNPGRSVSDDYYNTTSAGGRGDRGGRYDDQMSSSPRGRGRGRGHDNQRHDSRDDNYENVSYNRGRPDQGSQGRGRGPASGRTETQGSNNQKPSSRDGKATTAGLFENPDKEGYLYDYEHVKTLSGDDTQETTKKTANFENELSEAINNNIKRQQSANDNEATGAPASHKPDDVDKLADKQHSDSGPDAHSSPKPNKKLKRKSSKERKSPKSSRRHDDYDVSKSPESKLTDEESIPPEAFEPIFSEEPKTASYVPSNQYQPGYQGNYPPAPYDPRYPMGGYPYQGPPGAPYQQAGQAQWFMEATPTGQQKMAFAMTTHSQGSQDDGLQAQYGDVNHPGMPGYTSTPYHTPGQPGHALVPAGTVLDDPQVPPPGTSLVRYDDDPHTGVKTAQVIWTDAKRDMTDPPPDTNPQVTRKTITRVTTKAGNDDLPDAPNPNLQDLTLRTAHQIQASGGEPAFMSPSRGAVHYAPSAIQYVSPTPEKANSAFYTVSSAAVHPTPGSPTPVIHEAPVRNAHIRDRITMSTADD